MIRSLVDFRPVVRSECVCVCVIHFKTLQIMHASVENWDHYVGSICSTLPETGFVLFSGTDK